MSKKLSAVSWIGKAACKGVDYKLFTSLDKDDVEEAKKYCADCPVKMECYFAYGDLNCTAGGTTLYERLLRNWKRTD